MNEIVGAVKERGSLILAVISVGGVFATGIFAAKGGLEAEKILAERDQLYLEENSDQEEVDENGEPVEQTFVPASFREKFGLTWRCYVPAGISGVITIACIIGNQYISTKQIAALTASVGFLMANRNQLEDAIREKYGEDALQELKQKIKLRKPEKEIIKCIAEETGKGNLLCFDGYSGRWFRSNEDAVVQAIKAFSDMVKAGGYVSWNDLFRLYGIEESHFGFQWGYPSDGDGLGYDYSEGCPMYVTRVFDDKYMEDVLYIDLGSKNGGVWPVYPMEGWFEY
jgi:hypothetical protein